MCIRLHSVFVFTFEQWIFVQQACHLLVNFQSGELQQAYGLLQLGGKRQLLGLLKL